jgi:hypothetical protein
MPTANLGRQSTEVSMDLWLIPTEESITRIGGPFCLQVTRKWLEIDYFCQQIINRKSGLIFPLKIFDGASAAVEIGWSYFSDRWHHITTKIQIEIFKKIINERVYLIKHGAREVKS